MVRSMTCDVAAISICEAIGHLATSIVPHPPLIFRTMGWRQTRRAKDVKNRELRCELVTYIEYTSLQLQILSASRVFGSSFLILFTTGG